MKSWNLVFVIVVFAIAGCVRIPLKPATVTEIPPVQESKNVQNRLPSTGEWLQGTKQEEPHVVLPEELHVEKELVSATIVVEKTPQEKAADFFQKGIVLVNGAGKWNVSDLEAAVLAFDQAIALDPGMHTAYLNLGLAYFHLGKVEKAIEKFEYLKAGGTGSLHERGVYNLGISYLKLGDTEKAYTNFLLLKGSGNAQVLSRLGEISYEKGLFDQAEQFFSGVVGLNPDDPAANFNLGMLFLQRGGEFLPLAQKAFRKTTSRSPKNVDAYFYLGVTYYLSGDLERATKMFSRVTRLAVDYAEAYYNLGLIFYEKEDVSNAVMYFTLAKRYHYSEAAIALAKIYLETNKEESALETILGLTREAPQNHKGFYALGVIYQSSGRNAEAMKAYEKAVELAPEDIYALSNLAVVYRHQGAFDKAIETNHKIIKMDSDHKSAHKNMGIIFDLYLNNYKVAKYHYNEYLRIGPEKADHVESWLEEIERR